MQSQGRNLIGLTESLRDLECRLGFLVAASSKPVEHEQLVVDRSIGVKLSAPLEKMQRLLVVMIGSIRFSQMNMGRSGKLRHQFECIFA